VTRARRSKPRPAAGGSATPAHAIDGVIWHTRRHGRFPSFLGFDEAHDRAIFVVPTPISMRSMRSAFSRALTPTAPAPPAPVPDAAVDAAALEPYVGRYRSERPPWWLRNTREALWHISNRPALRARLNRARPATSPSSRRRSTLVRWLWSGHAGRAHADRPPAGHRYPRSVRADRNVVGIDDMAAIGGVVLSRQRHGLARQLVASRRLARRDVRLDRADRDSERQRDLPIAKSGNVISSNTSRYLDG